ncbi:MAG TPA: NAD-dependent epimerase/dehydratase family protein [Ideonella sp.]|uniref:NAD-dependent epimerase/dehydratase family protein n=1 Tax=Ideonella sp. TaxID=1929293 RepID=UPI002CC092E2|nr:NAD-dependent epimerase/dehydratase family protein [Ideonella sp.]HSI48422.1 NAD-dependent epimerase/dehydratase family protein [Ideonella sp.]
MNPVIAEDVQRILAQPLPWDELNGSTVLISGASGFLPAYMVETLAVLNRRGAGMRIVGLVRSRERAAARLAHLLDAGLTLVEHDVSTPLPPDLMAADYIVHAASQASPRFYGVDPVGTLEANTIGTSHLLRHAAGGETRSFLFFSSGEVYGVPVDSSRRLTETDFGFLDPATVRACYGESKRMGETLCVSWAQQFGVPARIVRPFHTYGPGMSLTDGRVFADFVADVVARRDIVLKSDGLAMRPFCYLADATTGFFTALLKGEAGKAYNVGNPAAETSIRDLAHLMTQLFPDLGLKVELAGSTAAPTGYLQSQVNRSVPDVARIEALGWQAMTGLSEGFRRTVRSFDPRLV